MLKHLGMKLKPGSPTQVVDPYDLPTDTALKIYGLAHQARFGNCNTSAPWAVEIKARYKWDAWNAEKGLSRREAADQGIQHLEAILQSHGHSWTWNQQETIY